jgi:hypothetical protein
MDGRLTHRAVAEAHGMDFEPPFQSPNGGGFSILDSGVARRKARARKKIKIAQGRKLRLLRINS